MRKGDYIETYTGQAFYPFDPVPTEIEIKIKDIAHSLSMQCRFNGHTKVFYSVAQHCVNIVKLMREDGCSPEQIFAGLLHDASEAYITDVPKPIKPYLNNYREIENTLQSMIYQKYGLNTVDHDLIKKYDDICLNIEGSTIMPNVKYWAKEDSHRVIDLAEYKPSEVKVAFLQLFGFYRIMAKYMICPKEFQFMGGAQTG